MRGKHVDVIIAFRELEEGRWQSEEEPRGYGSGWSNGEVGRRFRDKIRTWEKINGEGENNMA